MIVALLHEALTLNTMPTVDVPAVLGIFTWNP